MKHYRSSTVELPTSSMADVAFLLLSFFLITTVIENHKGLTLQLPPWQEKPIPSEVHARNIFTIQINSEDQCLVEGERVADLSGLKEQVRAFVMNQGKVATLSDNPEVAVVSLKTDRGTTYSLFVRALDEIQGAYYEIYAERVGITSSAFRALQLQDPRQKAIYEKARRGIPMNLSIAEPTCVP